MTEEIKFPPTPSPEAIRRRLEPIWPEDGSNGSIENAIKFMQQGWGGTVKIKSQAIIQNSLHIGGAGKYLYMTVYENNSFEIRDFRFQIVASGGANVIPVNTIKVIKNQPEIKAEFIGLTKNDIRERLEPIWPEDRSNGSIENAIKFLEEGMNGTTTVKERYIVSNDQHIGNAGKYLYKTEYHNGGYEIRDFRGQIIESGGEGSLH